MSTPPFALAGDVEMDIGVVEPGRVVASGRAEPRHLNPHGVVHGAVLFLLVDTAMGGATMSVLEEGQICASIEVHLRFLRPVAPGVLRAETSVVHRGRRVVQLESRVLDAEERLVATATGSFAVIDDGRPPAPS